MSLNENPLLSYNRIPDFAKIETSHVPEAIKALETFVDEQIELVEKSDIISWATVIEPFKRAQVRMSEIWNPVSHLNGVKNSEKLRTVYEAAMPKLIAMELKLSQNKHFYEKAKQLTTSSDYELLSEPQKRVIELALKAAEHSGIALPESERIVFNTQAEQLSQLNNKFSNNVLDSLKSFSMTLKKEEEVKGIPHKTLAQYAEAYKEKAKGEADAKQGPWLITLDGPSYIAFMDYAEDRDLRKKLYEARSKVASEGEFDNRKIALDILRLRKSQATLLGFSNYAEFSLAEKMANSPEEVLGFQEDILKATEKPSNEDLHNILDFAKKLGFSDEKLRPWDLNFYARAHKEEKFSFSAEEIKPYLPLESVLSGLFSLTEKLFSVQIIEMKKDILTWHKDVRFYDVLDAETKEKIASFYLDPFVRPENKRGGAWMADCASRILQNNQVQLPVAFLVCNFPNPVGDTPSLLNFEQVRTMFHEFGHGLQHMLTHIDTAGVSGIDGVDWDAVELASQFMENWCFHKETLLGMAKHYETGETLPESYFEKIIASKNYRSGQFLRRQLRFGMFDLLLHSAFESDGSQTIENLDYEVQKKTVVLEPKKGDMFYCSFSHIFAGGYAAGYYSYLWAEVLSSDAFAAFEEVGLDNDQAIKDLGQKYRSTILGLGGSKPPAEVYELFRGKPASSEAFLRHQGLS